MGKQSTKPYEKKRDFSKTPEPKGGRTKRRKSGRPRFVIHKHDASSLHYDFRLEVDGVLASWAVPKGPSTDPSDKRLAVRTEDHPMEYIDFEGVIPEGEYGAGTVMVWDTGTYENNKQAKEGDKKPPSVKQQIDDGHVTVKLHGRKIRGGYALTRTKMGSDDDENWLLVKMDDDEADARRNPTSTENKSVRSNRTMKQIHDQQRPGDGGDDDS